MKIKTIHLQNFKRFTDLTIENIPETSKLVLLIGTNASGKSSLFDAFGFCADVAKRDVAADFWDYYRKIPSQPVHLEIGFQSGETIRLASDKTYPYGTTTGKDIVYYENTITSTNPFYGRTSLRQVPRLTRTALGQGSKLKYEFEKDVDWDRPRFFIDRDERFENDIERIAGIIFQDVFHSYEKHVDTIREKYIQPINAAFARVFDHTSGLRLELIEFIPPFDDETAKITFKKGKSQFPYNCLSAGEKEVFNILINFMNRKDVFQDTIYFIDEIDLHLNTSLQFRLLKEITENWIPENCQLWTASHSLGFIEYAKQSGIACIIDFDNYDFDLPKTLVPDPKDNPDIYEIAVSKELLSSLFRDRRIVFVENTDRDYYAMLDLPGTIFVPANNRNQVYHKVRTDPQFFGIVDRDFLTDNDIEQIRTAYPRLHVLRYYSIENYLYHPDNLAEYHRNRRTSFDREKYIADLTEAKNREKDSFIIDLTQDRSSYPYFREPEYDAKSQAPLRNRFRNEKENKEQAVVVHENIKSDDFETFYKSLPMNSCCKHLVQRQNIPKSELAKTTWFRERITELLQ
ncbi:MAG: AAA family ATPase [Planctomycetaceae bacterium]|nr:AAA family ATPase [Planctomycetaceae bacterium]